MGYKAVILADSVTLAGDRLTTFVITFPRPVLSEFNTHRELSRNSASSRAIPVSKQIRALFNGSFEPETFGLNQPGMQALSVLAGVRDEEARRIWRRGRDRAILTALELILGEEQADQLFGPTPDFDRPAVQTIVETELARYERDLKALNDDVRLHPDDAAASQAAFNADYLNVHKQIANRVLEPYMWHTVIVTATEWSNFFALRTHADAQPEIRTIAQMMLEAYEASTPRLLQPGEWHLPLLQDDERADAASNPEYWLKVVIGRCARVSYLTHDGRRDPAKDVELYERLTTSGHMSPLEHAARAMTAAELRANPRSGNFRGWIQHRKEVPFEADYSQVLATARS